MRNATNPLLINIAVSEYDIDDLKNLNNKNPVDTMSQFFKRNYQFNDQQIFESEENNVEECDFWDTLRGARYEIS